MEFFLMYAIPVMIIYIIVVISKHAEKEETERRIKKDFRRMHVGHIHKTYPNVFSTYWGKPDLANSVFKDYSNVILNENSVNWTDYQWRILEDDLEKKKENKRQNEIQKKLWLISQIEEIRKSYPNGFREFKKRNPTSTDEDVVPTVENIVNNRVQIELLEKEYCNSQKENRLTAKVFAADEITEQMESYVIISIEPFVKVLEFDKTILVKSNKVIPTIVNNNIIGYNYSKEDDEDTRWIVFNGTEQNLQKLLLVAKECEQGNFWIPDRMKLRPTWVDYFDLDKKKDISHKVEVEITGFVANMTQKDIHSNNSIE